MTEVSSTDNKLKTSNNYEFLSFDNRKSKDGSTCNTWSYFGIEAFEYMAIVLLLIFILYKGGRKICGKNGLLEKRRNSKLKWDTAKFEKLRTRFENTGAVTNRGTNKLKGHVTDGNQGPAQALNVTTLKQLPPFVFEA